MRNKRRLHVGTQIILIPPHVRKSLSIPGDISLAARHPDVKFGFVSSWNYGPTNVTDGHVVLNRVYCRFWNPHDEPQGHKTQGTLRSMRTLANSEECHPDDLEQYDSVSPGDVNQIIDMFREEPERYGWHEQPQPNDHERLWEALEDMLSGYDWHYEMSDDNRWYTSGRERAQQINELVKQLGDEGISMFNDKCPYPELRKETKAQNGE